MMTARTTTATVVENPTQICFYGNVFEASIVADKPIDVEGDLVCHIIECPKLRVFNGSLICPDIRCPEVHADILGVFDVTREYQAPPGWSYRWLRPVLLDALPKADEWTGEESIAKVIALLTCPAIIGSSSAAHRFVERVRVRPTCARARVLFAAAVEELLDSPELLTPFGRQVLLGFAHNERLPLHWRF